MENQSSQITLSESSDRSPTNYEIKFHRKITRRELSVELARLNAVFGVPRDRTADLARVMANEWFNALSLFGAGVVRDAVTKAIASLKFWPTIAEVLRLCEAGNDDLKAILGVERGGYFKADQIPDLTEDEIARRGRVLDAIKVKTGFVSDNGDDKPRVVAPASQSMQVSPALADSCAARRTRGERVCGQMCSRPSCDLRGSNESAPQRAGIFGLGQEGPRA